MRLPSEPAPCELDRQCAQVAIAGLADALLLRALATRAAGAAKPRGGAHLAAIPELAPREELGRVDPRPHLADRARRQQAPHHRQCGIRWIIGPEQRAPRREEVADDTPHRREARPLAREPGSGRGWERRVVPGRERARRRARAREPAPGHGQCDAVQREERLDAVDHTRALVREEPELAMQLPAILGLDVGTCTTLQTPGSPATWRASLARSACVEPVRLRRASAAAHVDARRVDDDVGDAMGSECAVELEAVAARLVAAHHGRIGLQMEAALRRGELRVSVARSRARSVQTRGGVADPPGLVASIHVVCGFAEIEGNEERLGGRAGRQRRHRLFSRGR